MNCLSQTLVSHQMLRHPQNGQAVLPTLLAFGVLAHNSSQLNSSPVLAADFNGEPTARTVDTRWRIELAGRYDARAVLVNGWDTASIERRSLCFACHVGESGRVVIRTGREEVLLDSPPR